MRILLTGLVGLVALFVIYSCQKEVSLEYGSPAKGSLKGNGGDCLPKLVSGSYVAAKALNDSNFLEVTVDVSTPGPYTISTDTVNGFYFKASGTFSGIGSNTVRLKGSGVPTNAGVSNFRVTFDTTICTVAITVLPSGSTATQAAFTLQGSPNACAAFDLTGNYYKDSTLDSRHTIKLNVNVTSVGTYSITANAQNGYSFSGSGTFSVTGPTQVVLQASGKPVATGVNNFTVSAGTSTCTFPVTVTTPTTTPPTGPCGATPQGTYTAGTALTASNTIVISHTYATAGSYTVSTGTAVNGYSFGPTSVTATPGTATSITLTGTGTPTAAGTNTFTVNFGDGQSCTFTVTVNSSTTPPVNTDYFPIAANNWWSYNYTDGAPDTLLMKVMGSSTIGGQTYQRFEWSSPAAGGAFADYFYRKDASNGYYYEGMDTIGWGPQVIFTQHSSLHLNFLRNTLTTGQVLNNDYPVILNLQSYSGPATLRFKYTCANNNATITTANGVTLTNVYEVHMVLQIGIAGQFQDASDTYKTYYARGIGQVKYRDDSDPNDVYEEIIRHWRIN